MKLYKVYIFVVLFFSQYTNTIDPIYVGIASVPWREHSLQKTVASLLDQVDQIFVYLNNYKHVPQFLEHPKITYYASDKMPQGDLGASGKLFWILQKEHNQKALYWLSCDDDIEYPKDYVIRCIAGIERYNRNAIVALHGVLIPNSLKIFNRDLQVVPYWTELTKDKLVHIIGTGCMAFHTEKIQLSKDDFPINNKLDIFVGLKAQKEQIPLVVLSHPHSYLSLTKAALDPRSLWISKNCKDPLESCLCRLFIPWKTHVPE